MHGRHLRHLSRICGLSLQEVELQSLPCAFERQTAQGPGGLQVHKKSVMRSRFGVLWAFKLLAHVIFGEAKGGRKLDRRFWTLTL